MNIKDAILFYQNKGYEYADAESKVSQDIVVVESNLQSHEGKKTLENIDELQFMLDHIREKNQLKLKNIF